MCVAPTTASTIPSQALLFEMARAAGDFPTPSQWPRRAPRGPCAGTDRVWSSACTTGLEEDRLTLLLSKAFLLADDARITDTSILAQLGNR